MCGLVGVAGDLDYGDEYVFKRQLVLDVFRGMDSTGVAFIDGNNNASIFKMATNPLNLFQMKGFDKALNGYHSKVFLGHNRAATLGKVNDINAHPFQFGDIVGAHNGTLDTASWKRLEEAAGVETTVDSAAIFACINEIGIEETIKLMEKGRTSQTGAWALTWFDLKQGTLNFLRNSHRPLWYSFNKAFDKILWASEWPMIDAAVNLTSQADDLYVDAENYAFWPFEEDVLYSIPIDSLIAGITVHTFLNECKGPKLEGRKPAPLYQPKTTPQSKSGGKGPWKQSENASTVKLVETTPSTPNTSKTSDTFSNDEDWEDDDIPDFTEQIVTTNFNPDSPFDGAITEEEFERIAAYGCSFCSADVSIDDPNITVYKKDGVVLCADCSRETNGNQKIYV